MLLLFEASGENMAFCSDPSVTSAQALMEALLSRHFWVLDLMGRLDGFIFFNNPGFIQSVSWPRFLRNQRQQLTNVVWKIRNDDVHKSDFPESEEESLNAAVFHFICRSETQTYILWTHCVLAETLQQYGTVQEKNSEYMLIIFSAVRSQANLGGHVTWKLTENKRWTPHAYIQHSSKVSVSSP